MTPVEEVLHERLGATVHNLARVGAISTPRDWLGLASVLLYMAHTAVAASVYRVESSDAGRVDDVAGDAAIWSALTLANLSDRVGELERNISARARRGAVVS